MLEQRDTVQKSGLPDCPVASERGTPCLAIHRLLFAANFCLAVIVILACLSVVMDWGCPPQQSDLDIYKVNGVI